MLVSAYAPGGRRRHRIRGGQGRRGSTGVGPEHRDGGRGEPGEGEQLPEPDLSEDLAGVDQPVAAAGEQGGLGEERVSWQDIVVVVRKPFLKLQRIEVLLLVGMTMNDNLIQHVQFGGQLSYYLTGRARGRRRGLRLRRRSARALRPGRVPGAAFRRSISTTTAPRLNFRYVPIYGKFAGARQALIHWESYFTGGVGFTQSEVIPRDPAYQPFTNFLVTPNVGVSMRFFLTKFLTVTVGLRDYIFIDQFEPTDRQMSTTPTLPRTTPTRC